MSGVFNDRDIDRRLAQIGGEWIEASRIVPAKVLIGQLNRTRTKLKPLVASRKRLAPEEIVARSQPGVLVVAGIFKYSVDQDHHKENLQMVFKHCIPSRYILELIR